jgi:predicted Zn-dependent peptidase
MKACGTLFGAVALGVGLAACGGTSRLVAPLRYDARTIPAPETAPLPEGSGMTAVLRPLECPQPASFVLANSLHVLVVPRHAFPAVSVEMVFANDGAPQTRVDPVDRLLFGMTFLESFGNDTEGVEGGCHLSGCRAFARGMAEDLDPILARLAWLVAPLDPKTVDLWRRQFSAASRGHGQLGSLFMSLEMNVRALVLGHSVLRPNDVPGWDFDAVQRARRDILRPELATLVVAGDVSVEAVREAVSTALGGWARRADPVAVSPEPVEPGSICRVVQVAWEGPTESFLAVAVPGPPPAHADAAAFAVVARFFGGGLTSEVFRGVRENLGAAYFAGASAVPLGNLSYLQLTAAVALDRTGEALREMRRMIAEVHDHGMPDDAIARVKTSILAAARAREASSAGLASMVTSRLLGDAPLYDCETARQVESVTAADVLHVARTYLRPDAPRIVVVGPARVVASQLEGLGLGAVCARDSYGRDPQTREE